METKNYNKATYQSFDLTKSSTFLFTIFDTQNFINKNYNFIDGFFFYYEKMITPSFPFIINEFKIDDKEILPKGFFVDDLYNGSSIPFNEKFTPLNIPIGQGKFSLKITTSLLSIANNFRIIFKLKNIEIIDNNFDFFKYQTHNFEISSSLTSTERIYKNSIRPNKQITEIKGISVNFLETSLAKSNPLKHYQLGTFKMSINSKKSNPINIPIFSQTVERINYKKEFIELNEKIEPGSTLDFSFEEHQGIASTFPIAPSALLLFLTIKSK